MIAQLLKRKIVPDSKVARFGQAILFIGACLIPVLAFRKFGDMDLTEWQLLLGVLVTMTTALLCTVLGLMLERNNSDTR